MAPKSVYELPTSSVTVEDPVKVITGGVVSGSVISNSCWDESIKVYPSEFVIIAVIS